MNNNLIYDPAVFRNRHHSNTNTNSFDNSKIFNQKAPSLTEKETKNETIKIFNAKISPSSSETKRVTRSMIKRRTAEPSKEKKTCKHKRKNKELPTQDKLLKKLKKAELEKVHPTNSNSLINNILLKQQPLFESNNPVYQATERAKILEAAAFEIMRLRAQVHLSQIQSNPSKEKNEINLLELHCQKMNEYVGTQNDTISRLTHMLNQVSEENKLLKKENCELLKLKEPKATLNEFFETINFEKDIESGSVNSHLQSITNLDFLAPNSEKLEFIDKDTFSNLLKDEKYSTSHLFYDYEKNEFY